MERIAAAAGRLRRGDLAARVREEGAGEVRSLAAGFNEMATSLQHSLDASRRWAELNEKVLESAQDAYVSTDANGIIKAWNPGAERLFGYSAEEALGRDAGELILGDESERQASRERRRALQEHGKSSYHVSARHRDGRRIEMEVSAAPMETAEGPRINYFAREITDRLRREQDHLAAEAVSRALAEADTDEDLITPIIEALAQSFGWPLGGFWEYDASEGVVRCTHVWTAPELDFPEFEDYAREITYRPGEEVPDFPILKEAWDTESVRWDVPEADALSERQEAAGSAGLRAALALPVFSGQEMRGLLTFGSPSAEAPDAARLASLRSITDLIGQVMERRIAEREAERLKNEFFALVSHELRTPLTSIKGYLEIVRAEEAGKINDDQRRYLSVIDRNARRLMRLVGDLLFVAQVGAGRMALKTGEVDLAQCVTDAVDAARPQAEAQGVRLAGETEPATMQAGDHDRLGQLVDNLISNALKFTPEGGSVTVRLRAEGEQAAIEVADTGMGISQSDQENLFDRFYRTDDAAKQGIPGLGLGLSICKAIAEGHGGTISLRSEEGRGTTFTVELPLGRPAQTNGGPPAPRGEPRVAASPGS
jgi:PAS domain S-box-containing protein